MYGSSHIDLQELAISNIETHNRNGRFEEHGQKTQAETTSSKCPKIDRHRQKVLGVGEFSFAFRTYANRFDGLYLSILGFSSAMLDKERSRRSTISHEKKSNSHETIVCQMLISCHKQDNFSRDWFK